MKKLFSRENATVFVAMPKASVTTTAAVAAGVLSCVRTPTQGPSRRPASSVAS